MLEEEKNNQMIRDMLWGGIGISGLRGGKSRMSMSTLDNPKIVCLCGSTRFYDAFQKANYEETMKGNIVLSVGFYPHSQTQAHGEQVGCTPDQKQMLDNLHLKKIEIADEVLVLNVGGYIGESTRRELLFAIRNGKIVRFLEPDKSIIVDDLLNRDTKVGHEKPETEYRFELKRLDVLDDSAAKNAWSFLIALESSKVAILSRSKRRTLEMEEKIRLMARSDQWRKLNDIYAVFVNEDVNVDLAEVVKGADNVLILIDTGVPMTEGTDYITMNARTAIESAETEFARQHSKIS